ncbi:hypothetical protein PSYRMG_13400 [Pseudomonas syringae UMAF0158]|nr:hypothetical protein PSYRMG_13400 [Pseudomonas syringae UMAF0158]
MGSEGSEGSGEHKMDELEASSSSDHLYDWREKDGQGKQHPLNQ